jgi:NAD+ kinase
MNLSANRDTVLSMIRYDAKSKTSTKLYDELAGLLDFASLPEGLCLVIGGDGFLLSVIAELGQSYIYMGLNSGRLGFMLNDVMDVSEVVGLIKAGAWGEMSVPRLKMKALTSSGETIEGLALNDVYLERMSGQTAHLRVEVDGVEVVDRVVCDGLIVATALGSTAYSFSAGGPVCHPTLRHTQLTTISAHSPRLPPIVLPQSAVVEIKAFDTEWRPVRVVTDGTDYPAVTRVKVENANSDVTLAFFEGHDPTAMLIGKMLRT